MKKLSVILINSKLKFEEREEVEFIHANTRNLKEKIFDSLGEHICFICNNDTVSEDYLDKILEKCNEPFDACFINYHINYDYKKNIKVNNSESVLQEYRPHYNEYIWSFVYSKFYLLAMFRFPHAGFNEFVNNYLDGATIAIPDVIYFHNPEKSKSTLDKFPLRDYREIIYYKNIIYIDKGCCGLFNGFVSWLANIGRCFSDQYDITILYDEMHEITKEKLEQYYDNVVFNYYDVNYVCENLITQYGNYDYPRNLYPLEESIVFIHGLMETNYLYFDHDLYSRYIAVSKASQETTPGCISTEEKIDYIQNPIKITEEMQKPHLRLISAQRCEDIKRIDRLESISQILDEEDIPYTWNVFSDKYEAQNNNGLIYRNPVFNTIPYIKDSDYMVLLSDTEAFPYTILESLTMHTKVVVTPLKTYEEMGVKDGENGFYIPFEYFEPENKEKLREKVLQIYKEKAKTFEYNPDEILNYYRYNEIFKK